MEKNERSNEMKFFEMLKVILEVVECFWWVVEFDFLLKVVVKKFRLAYYDFAKLR